MALGFGCRGRPRRRLLLHVSPATRRSSSGRVSPLCRRTRQTVGQRAAGLCRPAWRPFSALVGRAGPRWLRHRPGSLCVWGIEGQEASRQDPAEWAPYLSRDGYCSYTYTGAGLTTRDPAEWVILHERVSNHDRGHNEVMAAYIDGHVEFARWADLQSDLQKQRAAQTRPSVATQPMLPTQGASERR